MGKLQHWIVDRLNTDENTAATILITLFVLISGWIVSQIAKSISLIISRYQRRSAIYSILKPLQYSISKQSACFLNISEKLDIHNHEPMSLKTKNVCEARLILNFDYELVYQSFLGGVYGFLFRIKNKRLITSIYRDTQHISNLESKYLDDLDKLNQYLEKIGDKRNKAIGWFGRLADNLKSEINGQLAESYASKDFINEFSKIITKWQKTEFGTFPDVCDNNLVQPILGVCRKYENVPYALRFFEPLLEASIQYKNLKNTMKMYSDLFFSYGLTYKAIARKLKIINRERCKSK